jgi:hypothetical protein
MRIATRSTRSWRFLGACGEANETSSEAQGARETDRIPGPVGAKDPSGGEVVAAAGASPPRLRSREPQAHIGGGR